MSILINIVLAIVTFCLYVPASGRFYRRQEPFLGYLAVASFSTSPRPSWPRSR